MKRLAIIASTSLALLLGGYVQSAHAVPTTMSFTGRLQDSSGPVTGAVQVIVKIYDAAAVGNGTEVWTETHTVTADAGLVYLELGTTTPLDEGVFDGRDLWLDITVNGDQQSPRMAFNTVPYATRAAVADSADTLGTLGPTDVALAGHDHAGTYSPTAHNHDGAYSALSHNHDGTYLPVGATLSCTGTQKVTGLGMNGSVVCGDDADTNTTYTAGTGLTLTTGQFAVDFGMGSNQAARGNHNHDTSYYLQSTLNATGTINAATNPVAWTKLKGVPAGFADGVDNDSGGDVTEVAAGSGLTVSNGTGPVPTLSIGTGAVTATHLGTNSVGLDEINGNSIIMGSARLTQAAPDSASSYAITATIATNGVSARCMVHATGEFYSVEPADSDTYVYLRVAYERALPGGGSPSNITVGQDHLITTTGQYTTTSATVGSVVSVSSKYQYKFGCYFSSVATALQDDSQWCNVDWVCF